MKHPLFQLALTVAISMAFLWACLAAVLGRSYQAQLALPLSLGGIAVEVSDAIKMGVTRHQDCYVDIHNHETDHPIISRKWRTVTTDVPSGFYALPPELRPQFYFLGLEIVQFTRGPHWAATGISIPHWINILFFGVVAGVHFWWKKRKHGPMPDETRVSSN